MSPVRWKSSGNALSKRGMDATILSDPEEALRLCRDTPPNLAIVEDPLRSMSGTVFLGHLVRISWITSTILIADSDEKQVHERAEGLGILGHLKSPHDKEGLDLLLEKIHCNTGLLRITQLRIFTIREFPETV